MDEVRKLLGIRPEELTKNLETYDVKELRRKEGGVCLTLLDTSIVINRVKGREPVREDITFVTFVEYPRIIYYKHFYGGNSVLRERGVHASP